MKKSVALLLISILFISSLVFASEELTPGEKLADLGLVKGDAQGNLLEDETLTRAQMMVLLARLNGVEIIAENYDTSIVFRDVPVDSYYAPFIAYAYAQGWTKGTGEETFSPEAMVNGQMVATFMLRVLGYDVAWESAINDAAQLGIVDDVTSDPFTRRNAFDMIYDTVKTKVADENQTLGALLGLGEDLSLVTAKGLSNTRVELVFSSPLDDESIDLSKITISDLYNDNNALEIEGFEINNSVVTLTTKPMNSIVYGVELKGIEDIYGNPLDSDNDTLTFAGRDQAEKIEEMTIKRIDSRKLAITFDQNIDERAANLDFYTVSDEMIEPEEVATATELSQESYSAVKDYKKTVILTLPETKAGQVYTLKVSEGLVNIDGVETTEVLTENFIGAGITTSLPIIEEVIATDAQTLKIYFDRDVRDETIDGRLWNQEKNIISGSNILSVDTTGNKSTTDLEDLDLAESTYAYQPNDENNVLIVRMNRPVFNEGSTAASNNNFYLIGNSEYVYSQDESNILTFEPNDTQVTNPTVEGVVMLNEKTIEVNFNGPVQIENMNAIKIFKTSGDASDNTLITTIKNMTTNNGFTWTMALERPITPEDAESNIAYFYLPDGAAKDETGTVDVMDASTSESYQSLAFGTNYTEAKAIDSVFAIMPDNRSIEVIYPEDMNISDVTNEENYLLLVGDDDEQITELKTVNFKANYGTYDYNRKTATLYLDAPIMNDDNIRDFYLAIDSQVKNVLETKTIKGESMEYLQALPSNKGLTLQFAPDTEAPEKPVVEDVKVSDDRYAITLQFNEDIAFASANNVFHPSRDLTNGLTPDEFLEALAIQVQFENEEDTLLVQSENISSVSGIKADNEQSVKVTFNRKLAVDSLGQVTTKGQSNNQIFNRKSAFAEVDDSAVVVSFGVDESLYSDGEPPKLSIDLSQGIDSDGDGKLNQVILVYDENMILTQSLDTNEKVKTLITELVVDNGTEFIDLRETMTVASINGNELIINLEDTLPGTGVIKVSTDSDTGGSYGQLKDTSILKAPDEVTVSLADTVAPVLIKATGTLGSEAIRLSFSERVSGGTPDSLENIQVSDLNWIDISGDGASFIKFILSSKNKANHGIVIDQALILNDLGKDTLGVLEDSIFDGSGNSVLSNRKVVIEQ